jgi:gamma-glutamylcyclotransferase (GGCT)/AIG2-like uncharacterized protein YtfP
MKKEEFAAKVEALCVAPVDATTAAWIAFAGDTARQHTEYILDSGVCDGFTEAMSKRQTLDACLDDLYNAFSCVHQKYGSGITQQIYRQAEKQACMYPNSFMRAAEYLKNGGPVESLFQKSVDEEFENGKAFWECSVQDCNSAKRLYIAYGSNLNLTDMSRRCPGAKVVGAAELKDYELLFRCHANVEPREGANVPVGVFEIGPQDERKLDFYEGYPSYYGKETVTVELESGPAAAMVYTMNPGRPPELPRLGYLKTIEEGYKAFGFDFTVLERAVDRTHELLREQEQTEPEPGSFPAMKM